MFLCPESTEVLAPEGAVPQSSQCWRRAEVSPASPVPRQDRVMFHPLTKSSHPHRDSSFPGAVRGVMQSLL